MQIQNVENNPFRMLFRFRGEQIKVQAAGLEVIELDPELAQLVILNVPGRFRLVETDAQAKEENKKLRRYVGQLKRQVEDLKAEMEAREKADKEEPDENDSEE